MPADLPADVPATLAALPEASVSADATVPVAYGLELDADVCLDVDLGDPAVALHSGAELDD